MKIGLIAMALIVWLVILPISIANAEDLHVKAADETVTNSTVVQNDDHLIDLPLPGVSGFIVVNVEYDGTNSVHDLKLGVRTPSAQTHCSYLGMSTADALGEQLTTGAGSAALGFGTSTTNRPLTIYCGYVNTAADSGELDVVWSGNATSSGNSTTVYAGSSVRIWPNSDPLGPVPLALADLTDVNLSGISTGSILEYDGADWVVGTDDEGEGGSCEDCVSQEDFDAFVLASHTCGGEGQDPCTYELAGEQGQALQDTRSFAGWSLGVLLVIVVSGVIVSTIMRRHS